MACYLNTIALISWSSNVPYPVVQALASIMEGLLRKDSPTSSIVIPLLKTIAVLPVGKDHVKRSGLKKSFITLAKLLKLEGYEWIEDKTKVDEELENCIESLKKRWKEGGDEEGRVEEGGGVVGR